MEDGPEQKWPCRMGGEERQKERATDWDQPAAGQSHSHARGDRAERPGRAAWAMQHEGHRDYFPFSSFFKQSLLIFP